MSERRAAPRVPIDRRVGIVQSDGEVVYGRASDLSMGGVSVKCRHSADVGRAFDIFFQLDHGVRARRFEARAKVVYVHYIGNEHLHRLGMQFLEFKGDSREILSQFVSDRLR
ncbi:PilZ domain-containing protein [Endothiovibrio diazotrophicus]